MAFAFNVGIIWEELLKAFSARNNCTYFLDNLTGELFAVPSNLDDRDFWRQMEIHGERFLRIPGYNYNVERQILKDFIAVVEDEELKRLLSEAENSAKPFGNLDEILSFFPEEEFKFGKMREEFFAKQVKQWLKVNNLSSIDEISLNLLDI